PAPPFSIAFCACTATDFSRRAATDDRDAPRRSSVCPDSVHSRRRASRAFLLDGFRQIEIAGDGADALAFVEHQPDRLRLEVVIEPATRPSPFGGLFHGRGHRIRLSESVHETGSSTLRSQWLLGTRRATRTSNECLPRTVPLARTTPRT